MRLCVTNPRTHVTVVGVSNEPQAPPRQFAIQFVNGHKRQCTHEPVLSLRASYSCKRRSDITASTVSRSPEKVRIGESTFQGYYRSNAHRPPGESLAGFRFRHAKTGGSAVAHVKNPDRSIHHQAPPR
jgi:hypothetical protein